MYPKNFMLMSANIANHLFRGGGRDRWRIFGALSIVQFWCPALSLVFGLRWVRDSARVFTQMLFSVSCYFLDHGGLLLTPRSWQYLDCYQETERQLRQFCFKVRGWGGLGLQIPMKIPTWPCIGTGKWEMWLDSLFWESRGMPLRGNVL